MITGFDPIVHAQDRVLILGSMPSVESLHQQFYYANKTNRFWPMMGSLFCHSIQTVQDKLDLLETHQIALWDVCHTCTRQGSMDAQIRDVVCNDIELFLREHQSIQKIICNGRTSADLMKKHFKHIEVSVCPSTSAANARWRLNDLIEIYGKEICHE